MDFLFIQPIQNEPFDGKHSAADDERLVGGTEGVDPARSEMQLERIVDEFVRAVSQQIRGDGVRADDAEREAPGGDAADIDDGVKAGEQQETPAAAIEGPGWRPDALHAGADAARNQGNIFQSLRKGDLNATVGDEAEREENNAAED